MLNATCDLFLLLQDVDKHTHVHLEVMQLVRAYIQIKSMSFDSSFPGKHDVLQMFVYCVTILME